MLIPLDIRQPVQIAVTLKAMGASLRKAHAVLEQLAAGKNATVQVAQELFETHAGELKALGVSALPIRKLAPDPKAVRNSLGISQAEFAARFCLELDTVQNWEQGRSKPDPAANVLLRIIAKCPSVVESVVTESDAPADQYRRSHKS